PKRTCAADPCGRGERGSHSRRNRWRPNAYKVHAAIQGFRMGQIINKVLFSQVVRLPDSCSFSASATISRFSLVLFHKRVVEGFADEMWSAVPVLSTNISGINGDPSCFLWRQGITAVLRHKLPANPFTTSCRQRCTQLSEPRRRTEPAIHGGGHRKHQHFGSVER